MTNPRQVFEENIRPAELLLRVYRLLECDTIHTEGDMVAALRSLVQAAPDEDLMLVYNAIFLGLVRENAPMRRADLKRSALDNLLRQAVVAACTGLDTFLPALLRANLPTVLEGRGRAFIPNDRQLIEGFKGLTFDFGEVLRILVEPDATLFIANKLERFVSFSYLSSTRGVRTVGLLLALDNPWELIATKLGRKSGDLETIIKRSADRRNDIVHRADRSQDDPTGAVQNIGLAWAEQAVDTVKHVCLALDELVTVRMAELRAEIAARTAGA